jgi:hypothetical protein
VLLGRRGAGAPLLSVAAYFCSMNAAALVSWVQLSRRFDVWDPTRRVGSRHP